MKRFDLLVVAIATFLAVPASAADMRMPVKAPPPVVAPVFTWTVCYIGIHGGYAWGRKKDWTALGGLVEGANHNVDGPLFGGQIGCNLQHERWVFGIEGQASWADVDGEAAVNFLFGGLERFGYHTKADIVGSIAARLGIAFDRSLLFVKGGVAFAHEKHWITRQIISIPDQPEFIALQTDKYMRWGWMVGGGWEYAFSGNWSGKIEYNYLHLGKDADSLCSVVSGPCQDLELKQHIQLVKVGINYRFGGGRY